MYRNGLVALGLAAMLSPASAEDPAERGRALVEEKCAGCHAIGREGASPLTPAPPFRILGQRYPLADLEEALAEGILTAHPAMPQFMFGPEDVGAIIAYLETIQAM